MSMALSSATQTMGAPRRRTNSAVMRNGYHSESTPVAKRRSLVYNPGSAFLNSYPSAPSVVVQETTIANNNNNNNNNNNHNQNNQNQNQNNHKHQRMARRRSTGYDNNYTTPAKQPFQSNAEIEENGSFVNNNNNMNNKNNKYGIYNGYADYDDHDSYSSSSSAQSQPQTQSLDEINKDTIIPVETRSTTTTTPSVATSRIRTTTTIGKSKGNKSDSDLEAASKSNHKRALHAAGMPLSVLKGINNHNKRRNYNHDPHNNNNNSKRSESDPESSLPPEYMVRDESSRSHAYASDASSKAEAGRGGGGGGKTPLPPAAAAAAAAATTTTPGTAATSIEKAKFASKLWSALRTSNPIVLLLVMGVSSLGVGLYTQSYAQLSITLERVVSDTSERRKLVAGRFESVEENIYGLQQKILELDPDGVLLLGGGEFNDDTTDNDADNDAVDGDNDTERKQKRHPSKREESGLFDEMVAVKEKVRISTNRISAFEKYIQATSLRDATRKYGRGVLRVQMSLEFLSDRAPATTSSNDNNKNSSHKTKSDVRRKTYSEDVAPLAETTTHTMVLEMAPLELMPHSVYTFLEMVDAKLIDGCSFVLYAMNTIKAAPLPYDGSRPTAKVKAFRKLGLDTLSFREYSKEFPHEQFTVGFAADGSPDFYINTDDNTEQHVGEPCFARIVSGFDTIEKMEDEPTRSMMWYKKRIGIKKAVII